MPDSDKAAAPRTTPLTGDDLAFAPMHVLAERMRTDSLTPSALLDLYLSRIRRHDEKLHAFVAVYEEDARRAADAADRAIRAGQHLGPLHGIPIALKDLLDIAGRVTTAAGDFFSDPLPRADVVTMGMILHDWNLEKKKLLIRKAYEALPADGAFIVVENLIDDERRSNAFGLLMSLNMLIEFGDAFDYTGADFREWCTTVGFRRFEMIPLAGPSSAAVAYK